MRMHDLIKQYVALCKSHSETDFSDRQAVLKANDTMRQLSAIVRQLRSPSLIKEFSLLLDNTEYKINLWVAHHIVEQLSVDEETEERALEIIRQHARKNDNDEDDMLF
jgi:transcription initiation factor TFIIIB Brf1 subunit/transcription initiation factor TFIIB